ncbi:hypothetical protein AVEN_66955-1 [Araneus ventricosus]|uniref:Uncharacterized protein n=1 Tax=Araneus ventricosus TaxID=182803 RepID=A0A4Y2UIZ7_ARAVE|nr:hypothetical protein AVEN_66955-1 [Araneus ventricosus]
MFRNKLSQMKNIDDIFSNPSSTSDAVSQADVKMFHPIYKAHANEQNLNNRRNETFLKSSTKVKSDHSSLPPTKGEAEQHTFSNVILFCQL